MKCHRCQRETSVLKEFVYPMIIAALLCINCWSKEKKLRSQTKSLHSMWRVGRGW